ncbi:hypothetical protein KC322_g16448, partial [Hortaea werneckii]
VEPRNDLASLCQDDSGFVSLDESSYSPVEELHLDQETNDSAEQGRPKIKFTPGNKVDVVAQEAEIERKKRECFDSAGKAKMLSLMQYSHLDTSNAKAQTSKEATGTAEVDSEDDSEGFDLLETAIEDDALRAVLREEGSRVGYVFTKTSTQ